MKFQLMVASAALFVASAAAIPTPQTDNHGLVPDTDDWVDGADALVGRDLIPDTDDESVDAAEVITARADPAVETAAADFNFTTDFSFPLDRLFGQIQQIPDEILAQGDEALHKWLVEHGFRAGDAKLKRDTEDDVGVDGLSLLERGELAARASIWKIAKCVAAIVQLLATTAVPAAKLLRIKKYIEALGGTEQAVKLLLGATTRAEKLKAGGEILVNLSAELLGISSVKNNCF
ncbi:hypothetical protein VTK56DRAFT_4156 [Thermocarpiscus australiensis]